jgi:hypothetical protein
MCFIIVIQYIQFFFYFNNFSFYYNFKIIKPEYLYIYIYM